MEEIINWEKEFSFRISNGAVTEPVNGSYICALALYLGYEEPWNGSWFQTICFHFGVTDPVNVSWYQALCEYFGFTTPINNSWKYTLAFVDVIEPVSNTNWEDVNSNWEDADEWTLLRADFSVNDTTIIVGGTVSFTDTSYALNPVENYYWEFGSGNPTFSTVANPIVQYDTVGTYSVSLTVSNDDDASTITKNNFIIVEPEPLDPDAIAFLSAASITDPIQTGAINDLVVDLKNAGIWTKMIAIYPFVGGTAATHKWNLKDPRDLNAAYRLTMYGSLTHSSTGVKGSVGYMDTNLPVAWSGAATDIHLSFYSRLNIKAPASYDIGSSQNGSDWALIANYDNNLFYAGLPNYTNNTATNPDAIGFYQVSRIGNQIRGYKNNSELVNNPSGQIGATHTRSLYILAVNVGGAPGSVTGGTLRETAYVTIGRGLTPTELSNHNTIVQAYQTKLNRNV